MVIAIILLILWLVLGVIILSGKVELTKAHYLFTWIALMLALIKNLADKM